MSSQALADWVVLECSGGVATRYCGKLFAAHGARVVQSFEPDNRHIGYGGTASHAYAAWLDDGKESINFGTLSAAGIADAIAPDLIIAGQYPADIARARLLASTFKRPPLLLALTWFGEVGPCAGWRGTDAVIQAMTGVAYAFGPRQGAPVLPQGHAPQVVAGATAFIAAMSCLIDRAESQTQRHTPSRVDINILEAHMCLSEHSGPGFAATGIASERRGVNRYFPVYPQTIFASADGWIGVTALTPQQWQGFCELIGLPDLARDPTYSSTDLRMASAQQLDEILAPALRKHTSAYLLEEGQRLRVPMAPVPNMAEVLSTPHWLARTSFRNFEYSSESDGARVFQGPAMSFRLAPRARAAATQELKRAEAKAEGSARDETKSLNKGPLAGIRVLDLSMGWSGPLCGRHFADLGAEVIKVEGCAHMDWWRGWNALEAGDPPPHETKSNFNAVNRNKHGITLDLRAPRGLEILRQLATNADLLIENYAPGVLDRLGLSAESLARINPRLSYVSMGAFGSAGPWSNFRAYGSTTEQASGMCFLHGEADWPPAMQHTAYGDPIAGIYAAVASLIALHARRRSQLGTTIDLSQVECLFQLCADGIVAQSATASAPARTGSQRPTSVWSGVVQCQGADQWIAIDIEDEQDLPGRLRGIGIDAPASAASLGAWAASRDSRVACDLLQAAGIAAGAVVPATALLEDAQLKAVGYWMRAERRHVGMHVLPKAPYSIDGQAPALNWPAPTLGEHNSAVLTRVLGMTPAEIADLEAAGVIGTRPAV